MKRVPLFAFLTFALLSCAVSTQRDTGFLDRTVTIGDHRYPYVVYVPRNYAADRTLPVILFLHGSGERGSDGLKQTQIGIGAAIRAAIVPEDAIVVMPQAPNDSRWLGEPADAAILALDHSMREFHGDPQRVYLTGLSMGGYGSWHLGMAHPDRFAALVVVCGGLFPHPTTTAVQASPLIADAADPYAFVATKVRHIPIWIFHGDADTVIPVDESRKMAAALRAENADVHYTELPGVGHNAWDSAYRDEAMWAWLFRQRLP